MKIVSLKGLSKKDYSKVLCRSSGNYQTVIPLVKTIMEDVRNNGDKALIKYYRKFNGDSLNYSIEVSKDEIKQAYKDVDQKFIDSISQMIRNISAVCKFQLRKKESPIEVEDGICVQRIWRPISKVGLYIPGGKAVYPSSVLMTGIPAQVAGCKEIIMCSPAGTNGKIPSPTLVAADMINIKKIYKAGGAEAVAAMTFGTKTIPNVYKIFGAGNLYVTAAKMLALEKISIDMPAGPSEVFIIADSSANPKFIAADLLADGEHGEDSACVLLTTSKEVAEKTVLEIEKQLQKLSTAKRAKLSLEKFGLIAVCRSLDEAVEFTNEYAPEHLEIMTANAQKLVDKIINAGSVFLGDWTSKSSGDYATGANHVLPTGGFAKMYQALSVEAFGRWMQVQQCTKEGLLKIKDTIENVATLEGLPAHANSVSIRFEKGANEKS